MSDPPSNYGFTLIEILVAITIFSIVALSVAAVFRSGLRTWSAGNEWSEENQNARNFFRVLSRELQNSVNQSPEMPFEGQAHEISFMTLLDARDPKEGVVRSLARVVYRYDAKERVIERLVAGKEEGFDARRAKAVPVAERIGALDLTYAFKPVYENENLRWKNEWSSLKEIPLGVRIRLDDFHTAVFVPTGRLGDENELE